MLTLEMIQDAKKTLEGVARVTPLYESALSTLTQTYLSNAKICR